MRQEPDERAELLGFLRRFDAKYLQRCTKVFILRGGSERQPCWYPQRGARVRAKWAVTTNLLLELLDVTRRILAEFVLRLSAAHQSEFAEPCVQTSAACVCAPPKRKSCTTQPSSAFETGKRHARGAFIGTSAARTAPAAKEGRPFSPTRAADKPMRCNFFLPIFFKFERRQLSSCMDAKEASHLVVLVLGGSCFVGRDLVDALVQPEKLRAHRIDPRSVRVVVMNRGNVYWKQTSGEERSCLPKGVLHIRCDRRDAEAFAKSAGRIPQSKELIVVDFCGFSVRGVRPVVKALRSRLTHYVFISSDSVYEVCGEGRPKGGRALIETDAVLPTDEKEVARLKKRDSYGYKKLKCEQYLRRKSSEYKSFATTCLRLSDVIGPYDDTDRLWSTCLWFARAGAIPIAPADDLDQAISVTSSADAVGAVLCAISKRAAWGVGGYEAFNVASDECVTLREFLKLVRLNCRGRPGQGPADCEVPITIGEGAVEFPFFPSVSRGPVANRKAKQRLDWRPSATLAKVVAETCAFFRAAESKYPKELLQAIKNLPKRVKRAVRETFKKERSSMGLKRPRQ